MGVHFTMRSLLVISVFCLAGVRLSIAREDQTGGNEKLSLHERLERVEREIEEVRTENKELREKIEDVSVENMELQERIKEVQNPPFGYFCSYQSEISAPNSVITYDKLLYSSQSGLQGDSPGIDINTGKFVSGFSGTYRVDFSLSTEPDPAERIDIYLYKNGQVIPQILFYSYRSYAGSGKEGNTGGRSVLLHLDLGDELYLGTITMEDLAYGIIFCVSLEQFDV